MTTDPATHPRVLGQWPKRCGTCPAKYFRREWSELRLKGGWADDYERLELRDCSCGSTLAVLVEVYQEDEG